MYVIVHVDAGKTMSNGKAKTSGNKNLEMMEAEWPKIGKFYSRKNKKKKTKS